MHVRPRHTLLPPFALVALLILSPACDDNPVKTEIITIQRAPQWRVVSQIHTLDAVTMFDADTGIALGDDGTYLLRSGGTWHSVGDINEDGDGFEAHGVWGVAPDDVFAVGGAGRIFHYNGSSWTEMTSPVDVYLEGVWGTAPDNVFAVGDVGTILHYDGVDWSAMTSNTQSFLHAVHGTGPTQVFAVGHNGAFIEYDGTDWVDLKQGVKHYLSVYAPSTAEVIAVGPYRAAARVNGVWGPLSLPRDDSWVSVSGTSADDVYLCSFYEGTVAHFDGQSWSIIRGPNPPPQYYEIQTQHHELSATSAGVVVVGNFTRIFEYSGAQWHDAFEAPIPSSRLISVWRSEEGDAWVSGGYDIWRIAGDELTSVPVAPDLVRALWGSGPDDVFGVGDKGAIFHFDGTDWSKEPSDVVNPASIFRGVYGTASNEVLAVGDEVSHYDGNAWTHVTSPDGVRFDAAWADGFQRYMLVGREGATWAYTGIQWLELDSGTGEDLWGVWGSSWNDIFAVGNSGTIIHYDGTGWTPLVSGVAYHLRGVWGRSASDVYAGGGIDDGPLVNPLAVVLHFDGTSWKTIMSKSGGPFSSISGNVDEMLYVGGGLVMKYIP